MVLSGWLGLMGGVAQSFYNYIPDNPSQATVEPLRLRTENISRFFWSSQCGSDGQN